MTTRSTTDDKKETTHSRSEIESALSGKTQRASQKPRRASIEKFDLSAPPRRQQVIGGKLGGISKRKKFGLFSRYSDISLANWIALAVVALIMLAFFWPSSKESIKETKLAQQAIEPKIGETDLTLSEQTALYESENTSSELSFSRISDIDRADDYRDIEQQASKIQDLLNQAKEHIAKKRLVRPKDSNATLAYQSVLLLDSRNIEAKQGLNFISNKLLNSGLQQLERDNIANAEKVLVELSSLNKQSDEYAELSNAIEQWQTQTKVDALNKQGIAALKNKQLLLPAKENALYFFKQALSLNENDEIANEGISRVAKSYVDQANDAINSNEYQAAAAHLSTISIIDPEHPSINSLEAALNDAIKKQQTQNNVAKSDDSNPDIGTNSTSTASNVVQNNSNEESATSKQTQEQETFDKEYLKQGLESYYKGEYDIAAALLQPLADKGIARAQFRLAYMHYLGRGFEQDEVKADSIIRAALPAIQRFADESRAWAQSDIGSLYEDGLVLPRDFNRAVAWYRSAAEQGYPGAQTNLGIMYARGRGVSTSRNTAIDWFKKAASQGDKAAARNLVAMGVKE